MIGKTVRAFGIALLLPAIVLLTTRSAKSQLPEKCDKDTFRKDIEAFRSDASTAKAGNLLGKLIRCAIRDGARSQTLVETLMDEVGFYVTPDDATKLVAAVQGGLPKTAPSSTTKAKSPDLPTVIAQLEANRKDYIKATTDAVAAIGPKLATPKLFDYLATKDGPTNVPFSQRAIALSILNTSGFAPLDEKLLIKYVTNPNLDDVARAFLVSKLATFDDNDSLTALTQVMKMKPAPVVRSQVAIAFRTLKRTDPASLDYLETLANSYLGETDKDVLTADATAIQAVIDSAAASHDSKITSAVTARLRDSLLAAIEILKNQPGDKARLPAAIVLAGQAGRIVATTDPDFMTRRVIPALMGVFDKNRSAVAQSLALMGPLAYPPSYDTLRQALFYASTSAEQADILKAITALVGKPTTSSSVSSQADS
jgi:hypothetical protein